MRAAEEKTVLIPIADGTEELEAVAIVDVLRRAGSKVTIASVDNLIVTASKGVKIIADCLIADCLGREYDLIAIPGGMPGSERLRDADTLIAMVRRHVNAGKLAAAICAAPAVILHYHGLLKGRRFTCHPNFAHLLADARPVDSPVVVDGNLVTSRGAGTAVAFALKLVELLYDRQRVSDVAVGMTLPRHR